MTPASPAPGSGCFLVLEGVEGAGKSTQLPLLARWLEENGHEVVTGREPGGTALGEAVRTLLLDPDGPEVSDEAELFLMLAARAAFVREVVRPALERGAVVVADRFDLSTLAYQGVGRGLGTDRIRPMIDLATGGLVPDRVVVLELPVAEGRARQGRAGKGLDRIESAGDDFLDRVAVGYAELARADRRAVAVDARGSVEAVHDRIRNAVRDVLPEPAASEEGSTPVGPDPALSPHPPSDHE